MSKKNNYNKYNYMKNSRIIYRLNTITGDYCKERLNKSRKAIRDKPGKYRKGKILERKTRKIKENLINLYPFKLQ